MSKKSKKKSKGSGPKPPAKKRVNLESVLESIYSDTVDLSTTCCQTCECCNVAMPQINYSEFVQIATTTWKEKSHAEILNIICTSLEYFFRYDYEKWGMDALVKPCMFLGEDKNCTIYSNRPLSCFLPSTLVMTQKGPIEIGSILAGDHVYDKDGEVRTVIATNSKMHEGMIYNVKSQGNAFDGWCTGDHEWLVSKNKDKRSKISMDWERADLLKPKKCKKTGHYVSYPRSFRNHYREVEEYTFDLTKWVDGFQEDGDLLRPYTSGKLFEGKSPQSVPKSVKIDSEFLFMIGVYLAEGSASSQSASFTMHIDEKPYLERIKAYLEGVWGLDTHYNKIKNGKKMVVLRIDSCLFARLMSKVCGRLSHNKAIHEDLFSQLSNESLMQIFHAWHVGDGRKCFSEKEWSGTTTSKTLCAQMQMTLMMNDIFPQIYKTDSSRRMDSYDVHVFPSNFRSVKLGQGTKRRYTDAHVLNPMGEKEGKMYRGPVVDIQVQGSESFITMSGIAHNCRIYGLWPDDMYNKRVDKFAKAYEKYGLKKEDLPLSSQCPLVKLKKKDQVLSEEVINGLYAQLDSLDKKTGNFSDVQVRQKENYRTFHDWLLLKILGEDWLSQLTSFILAADRETMEAQIEALKDVLRDNFQEKLPEIEKLL